MQTALKLSLGKRHRGGDEKGKKKLKSQVSAKNKFNGDITPADSWLLLIVAERPGPMKEGRGIR